jgi:hypothetical protein
MQASLVSAVGYLAGPLGSSAARNAFFVNQFRPTGAWDYKNTFQPGTMDRKKAQDFGNFAFGAVLASQGYDYYETQNAAGIAQTGIHLMGGAGGTGIPGLIWPFGDQKADALEVLQGWLYATKCGG